MTKEPSAQSRGAETTGSPAIRGTPWARRKAGASISISWRPVWFVAILIVVGVVTFQRYPHAENGIFYSTAAAVIATLYVTIALTLFTSQGSSGGEMTSEHWVFMLASSIGLLAALRALSVIKVHEAWQMRLLTALTVVGIIATVLLVAERLVSSRIPRTGAAVLWTVLFIASAITLVIFP